VAINTALEAPELLSKVIVDSFEGEVPLEAFTTNVAKDRELSKHNKNAKMFYQSMQGEAWEKVVDNDTNAIIRHKKEIGKFFHKDLSNLKPDILMTGSKQDEFISSISPTYFEEIYGKMLLKIGHGTMHLFETGDHPAMMSNQEEFISISKDFFAK
ncbi:MAG: alpha/beta hydrolase, partial [Oscillospiraceae bacterium]